MSHIRREIIHSIENIFVTLLAAISIKFHKAYFEGRYTLMLIFIKLIYDTQLAFGYGYKWFIIELETPCTWMDRSYAIEWFNLVISLAVYSFG